ncbi:DUF6668 family protein [Nocardia sp. CDC160]|uniref:DUF6668 family protein n=1 Tax=Nocardia sp. CDC160 TaxID=3112166 RepID=UPI002DBD30C9|nr:DUF6668 family protein [Nocardia sp. CDC160]MEC3919312.1 DUF6668 family protein [Nocardia sp. CDC160]
MIGPCPAQTIDGKVPSFWLLGAHGGAGVSTLAWMWSQAADCGRAWPAPVADESKFVVLVARETVTGLAAADALLRQHHAELAGGCTVLGLVTVAARPGRMSTVIRRDLALYGALTDRVWRVRWHEEFIQQPLRMFGRSSEDLSWRDTSVPSDVAEIEREILTLVEQSGSATTQEGGLPS